MKITVPFVGHRNILSLHEKTIEITKDSELTTNGDCIVGVGADISCIDLPEKMKKKIQNPKTKILFSIEANGKKFTISGYGSKKLSLKHTNDIVLRKSAFTCTRTVGINAENAAIDVPREMISKLRNPNVKGLFRIIIGETE